MKSKNPNKRYPPVYEKIIPIALGFIGVAVIILLVVIFMVTMGLFPGSR